MADPYAGLPLAPDGVIYIAIDARHMNECKIGMTTVANPMMRIRRSATGNRYYTLFTSYHLGRLGITEKELSDFETYLHEKLGCGAPFITTGFGSEWATSMSPVDAEREVEHFIAKCGFCVAGENFYDEDGNVREDLMFAIRFRYRPDPLNLVWRVDYEDCPAYYDLLMQDPRYK